MADVLIYGASGGIGSACAEVFDSAGYRVFGVARQINQLSSAVDVKLAFLAEAPETFQDVNEMVASESDGVDVMIYAVGSLHAENFQSLSADAWADVITSNLTSAFDATRYSLNLMRPDGHLVFIGAYIDHLILPKMGAYAVAKAGLEPFVDVLRKEHRKMRFTLVKPGATDTPFWENVPFSKPKAIKSPQVVAEAILKHHESAESGNLEL